MRMTVMSEKIALKERNSVLSVTDRLAEPAQPTNQPIYLNMKTTIQCLTGAILLGFTHFALAGTPADCSRKNCATPTKADCAKACKSAKSGKCGDAAAKASQGLAKAHYVVSGMTCEGCSGAVTRKLAAIDGVTVKKVCHQSGCAVVNYDPKKVRKEAIAAAINQGKFKVAAERVCVSVEGMTCGKCSEKLTTALNAVDGVTVKSVCHKSGKAVVDIDCAKSCRTTVVKTITATGFKAE